MSDIVESLRYWALPPAGETREPENAVLLKWAADEIERLQKDFTDLLRLAANDASKYQAKIETLRGLLQWWLDAGPDDDWDDYEKRVQKACDE